jgi:hypothetical protein
MTATQITTWGVTFDPFVAELKAQEAVAKGDRRLAHDIFWDASNNGPGQNGWCIPDRGSFNEEVWAYAGEIEDLSYSVISKALTARGRQPLILVGNPIKKATASIEILAQKGEGKNEFAYVKDVTVGQSTTTTIDKKLSMGLGGAFLGIEASVSRIFVWSCNSRN